MRPIDRIPGTRYWPVLKNSDGLVRFLEIGLTLWNWICGILRWMKSLFGFSLLDMAMAGTLVAFVIWMVSVGPGGTIF